MKFTEYIGSQFGNPRGIIGKICCKIMNMINKAMYNSICTLLKDKSKLTILDIGFGNGYLIKKLSKEETNYIYGIDISEDMLVNASKRNEIAINSGKMNLSIGDCCNLSFEDEKFDIITSVNTIYFWNDTLKGLSEIKRTLKQDGVFINVVYSKEWLQKLSYTKKGFKLFDKDYYIEASNKVGFSKVEVTDIVNGKSYLIKYYK